MAAVAISEATLPALVERTRDVSDEVRREAYRVLAAPNKVPLASLSISQRAAVLRRGLSDRAPRVRDAAILMLDRWLVGALPAPTDFRAPDSTPICYSLRRRYRAPTWSAGCGDQRGASAIERTRGSLTLSRQPVVELLLEQLIAGGVLKPVQIATRDAALGVSQNAHTCLSATGAHAPVPHAQACSGAWRVAC